MDIEDKYIKLAAAEARRYARRHGLLACIDDIKQDAYLLLCEYVHAGHELKPSHVRAHLRRRISRGVWFGTIDIPDRFRQMSANKKAEFLSTAPSEVVEGLALQYGGDYNLLPSGLEDPEEEITLKEILRKGLDKLSPAEYELIKAYCDEIPLSELARQAGCSREAMRQRKERITEKMK